MPYVERRNGIVVGVYAKFQKDYAEEELPESDPVVQAILNPPQIRQPHEIETLRAELDALKSRLVAKNIVTAEEIRPAIRDPRRN